MNIVNKKNTLIVLLFGLIKLILCYLVLWFVTYSLVMSFDYKYLLKYFYLSWTSPGEIPAFIQFVSISVLILIVGTNYIFYRLNVRR